MIEETGMKQNSRKAWKSIKILSHNHTKADPYPTVTANQIATQLIENGEITRKKDNALKVNTINSSHTCILDQEFSMEELTNGIKKLQSGKAVGVDNIFSEQILHFGPIAEKWLLDLYSYCTVHVKIPKT